MKVLAVILMLLCLGGCDIDTYTTTTKKKYTLNVHEKDIIKLENGKKGYNAIFVPVEE